MPGFGVGSLSAALTTSAASDIVMSADGTKLYTASADGNVRVYDFATRALIATWDVGTKLTGIDLSPDGTFLMVTEGDVGQFRYDGSYYYSTSTVYRVDTANGSIVPYSIETRGGDRTFYDVAFMSDNTVLLTQAAYSAHLPLWTLNLSTGIFTPSADTHYNRSTLELSADRTIALFADGDVSTAPLHTFEVGQGITHTVESGGYNAGTMAISLNAGLVVQNVMASTFVYNVTLGSQLDITNALPGYWLGANLVGMTFDATGANLFVLSDDDDSIYQISVADWSLVGTFAVGGDVGDRQNGYRGNRLEINADEKTFVVMTTSGLRLVQNNSSDNVFAGTPAADNLLGGTGTDQLSGLGGNDLLDGGTGADTMRGGMGDDTYVVDDSSDTVIEMFDEGVDTVESSRSYTLDLNIENLVLTGAADIDATGNADENVITGNTGSNIIAGGASSDTLMGGGGIDSFDGGEGNDRLVLTAAETGSSVDGGAGSDILVVVGEVSLGTLANLEVIELTSGASLTLTATQFNTGFYNPIAGLGVALILGTGSLIFNMDADPVVSTLYLTTLNFSGSSVVLTVNGTSGIDVVKGALGVSNFIDGGDGADQIRGGNQADTINGGNGDDKLFGWHSADTLTGGAGSDQFRYFFATDSGVGALADRITDFEIGFDKFNFVLIDADPVTPDDQEFAFLGTGAFTSPGTGQIRFQDSGADLLVQVDVDGNGTVDMEMILQGLAGSTLTSGHFML